MYCIFLGISLKLFVSKTIKNASLRDIQYNFRWCTRTTTAYKKYKTDNGSLYYLALTTGNKLIFIHLKIHLN